MVCKTPDDNVLLETGVEVSKDGGFWAHPFRFLVHFDVKGDHFICHTDIGWVWLVILVMYAVGKFAS